MKASLILLAVLFVSLWSAQAQEEKLFPADPVLIPLQEQLKEALRGLEPAAAFEISESSAGKSLFVRYKTRKYMVYRSDRVGRLAKDLAEEEGPDDEGFLLRIDIQTKGEVNQAEVPQVLRRPYWSTYLNVYPVVDSEKQVFVVLSYRGTVDQKLVERIKEIVGHVGAP